MLKRREDIRELLYYIHDEIGKELAGSTNYVVEVQTPLHAMSYRGEATEIGLGQEKISEQKVIKEN